MAAIGDLAKVSLTNGILYMRVISAKKCIRIVFPNTTSGYEVILKDGYFVLSNDLSILVEFVSNQHNRFISLPNLVLINILQYLDDKSLKQTIETSKRCADIGRSDDLWSVRIGLYGKECVAMKPQNITYFQFWIDPEFRLIREYKRGKIGGFHEDTFMMTIRTNSKQRGYDPMSIYDVHSWPKIIDGYAQLPNKTIDATFAIIYKNDYKTAFRQLFTATAQEFHDLKYDFLHEKEEDRREELEFMFGHYQGAMSRSLIVAAYYGRFEMLKEIIEVFGYAKPVKSRGFLIFALIGGHMQIIQHFGQHRIVVEYLHEYIHLLSPQSLEWVISTTGHIDDNCFLSIVKHNRMDLIPFFNLHNDDTLRLAACTAGKSGYIEMSQYFINNGYKSHVNDGAAVGGNIHILELFAPRVCPKMDALISACGSGKIETLRWTYQHFNKLPNSTGMNSAIINNQIEVIRYLLSMKVYPTPTTALKILDIGNNDLSIEVLMNITGSPKISKQYKEKILQLGSDELIQRLLFN